MHIVIVHGYFLKGTGSNLFVENICRELCKMGHKVTLFCQENDVYDIDFIEEAFSFDAENKTPQIFHSKKTQYEGKCTLFRPNLNGFLPVFVYDQYQGYSVKEFIYCSKEEIEAYLEYNKKAIDSALEGTKPNMVWTNHTIMQPVYVSRSNLEKEDCFHIMTVHGSCLNFAVRKSSLLTKYALEAIEKVNRIAFVSEYSKIEFLEYFKNDSVIDQKSVVIPGGVDLLKFLPLDQKTERNKYVKEMLNDIALKKSKQNEFTEQDQDENSWKTDKDIIEKLNTIDFEKQKIILYYGKYLWTKGIQLLIAAAPIVMKNHPDARFILVGYGSTRPYFEAMVTALDNRSQDEYIDLIKHPEKFDQSIDPDTSLFFSSLIKKLDDPAFAENYFESAHNKIRSALVFTGFLGHDHLKTLIACSDITAAPSIFPEAFGLVAVEALSAGIIPLQTNHSGFGEVIKKYFDEFSDIFDETKSSPLCLDEDLVLNIANNIDLLLVYYDGMNQSERQSIRERARNISINNYSYEAIVNRYLELII